MTPAQLPFSGDMADAKEDMIRAGKAWRVHGDAHPERIYATQDRAREVLTWLMMRATHLEELDYLWRANEHLVFRMPGSEPSAALGALWAVATEMRATLPKSSNLGE